MKFANKKFRLIVLVFILATLFVTNLPVLTTHASELGTPTFQLKKINNGTGVKIIIGKTLAAKRYQISITCDSKEFKEYKQTKWYVMIHEAGNTERVFTLNALPAGTYTFKVTAYNIGANDYYEDEDWKETYSSSKSIKIKKANIEKASDISYVFSNAKQGDIISFGSWEQDDNNLNGKEPIEWIVLSKTSDKMLVISRYALANLPYDDYKTEGTTWKKCALRKWLNGSFFDNAFSNTEKNMIKKVKLKNSDNPKYGSTGGSSTKDKVFLLSLEDVTNADYGFCSDANAIDDKRLGEYTQYALIPRASVDYEELKTRDGLFTCRWWLRNSGNSSFSAADIDTLKRVDYSGMGVNVREGVRPAIYIKLK